MPQPARPLRFDYFPRSGHAHHVAPPGHVPVDRLAAAAARAGQP